MNQTLVAVDGSKHSQKIADEAVTIAKSMAAKILLLYVRPDALAVPEEFQEYAKIENIDLSGCYSVVSDKILSKVGGRGVEFEEITEFGRASDEILDVAETRGVKMIIAGMHGLHAVGRVTLLGSTARRAIEQSPVFVVVPESLGGRPMCANQLLRLHSCPPSSLFVSFAKDRALLYPFCSERLGDAKQNLLCTRT
jgi:nucleotide-binding universal stress UspA family protein